MLEFTFHEPAESENVNKSDFEVAAVSRTFLDVK